MLGIGGVEVGINPVGLQQLADFLDQSTISERLDMGHACVTTGVHIKFGGFVMVNAVNGRSVIVLETGKYPG